MAVLKIETTQLTQKRVQYVPHLQGLADFPVELSTLGRADERPELGVPGRLLLRPDPIPH